ncbi:ATP-binding cassette domain-containing protein [Streptomyces sp. NPDC060031]|uniref:ATP-binding cassette domain-containing protein n=1 Tax=Streptomyces sp. NPDC060031 TaxID=3347043 RepID=UPI0036820C88
MSYAVPAGGSLGIVGESGSGKTTTARVVTGLEWADAGEVRVRVRVRVRGTLREPAAGGRAAGLRRAREYGR